MQNCLYVWSPAFVVFRWVTASIQCPFFFSTRSNSLLQPLAHGLVPGFYYDHYRHVASEVMSKLPKDTGASNAGAWLDTLLTLWICDITYADVAITVVVVVITLVCASIRYACLCTVMALDRIVTASAESSDHSNRDGLSIRSRLIDLTITTRW